MPRNSGKIVWLIILLIGVVPTFAQKSQKRVALILANGVYSYPNSLKNPAADASDLEQALKQLGFEVFRGININKQQTEKLIVDFGKRLAKTRGVGLFYYSGIGFQSNGENYLIPLGAGFASELETVKSSVPLSSVLAKMKAAKNKTNIILLDATHKTAYQKIWQTGVTNLNNIGFSKVSAPTGTVVFYSNQAGKFSSESCGRNGLFMASFLRHLENPLLEFGQLTAKVAAEVNQITDGRQKPFAEGSLKKPFYAFDRKLKFKPNLSKTLDVLFETYKQERKCRCGQREEAIAVGKEIVEKFGDDAEYKDVVDYVKKDSEKIAKEDPVCKVDEAYNKAYLAKDWVKFINFSKEIITREGNSPLALDVTLTLVSVDYDRAAIDKVDTYNADIINYAKQAIQKLESGATSQTGRWGTFNPFKTREFSDGKSNALSWMNYIIGWITYNRLGANDPVKKKEGLNYLYKSTLYNGEMKTDHTIYTNIGAYYFDQSAALDAEYRKIRAKNNNTETDEAKAKLALARGYADRAIDAFGRAYKFALLNKRSQNVVDALKKRLYELYRYRFNIAPDVQPDGVEKYFEKLISQPMPSPETKVEPVLQ